MIDLDHDAILATTEAALRELFRPLPLMPSHERGQDCVGCEEAILAEINEDELIWRGVAFSDGERGAEKSLRESISRFGSRNLGEDAPSVCVEGSARCERRRVVAESFFERSSERRRRLNEAMSVAIPGGEKHQDMTGSFGRLHSVNSHQSGNAADRNSPPEKVESSIDGSAR